MEIPSLYQMFIISIYLLLYRYQRATVYIYFIMSVNLSVFNLLRFNGVYLLWPEETVKKSLY